MTIRADVALMQREDGTMYRTASLAWERPDGEGATRSVSIAISSETPVLRYDWRSGGYFWEVLSHEASAVDLSRAEANGLPLLMGHNHGEIVGRARGVTVDADRRLRAADTVFARTDDGRDAQSMVEDGILTDTSVGYVVGDDYVEEKREGEDYPTRTYRQWTPFEVSLVTVPADPSVGVGRSAVPTAPADAGTEDRSATPAPVLSIQMPGNAAKEQRMTEEERAALAAQSRAETIRSMAVGANVSAARAEELIASGKSIRDVAGDLAGDVAARHKAAPEKVVDLTEKEQRSYSVVRALNALVNGKRDGFEFEVSDTVAKKMGRDTEGFFMPTSVSAQHADGAAAPAVRTLLSVGNKANTKGGEGVFTEYADFIDLLRARMVTAQMGAQMLSGLQGDLGFVSQSAAGTFSWGAETANASLSSLSTALRTMSPKIGQSATTISRQLLRQSSFDVENLVRNDIAAIHSIAIDNAAINGTGSSNQPRGIVNTVGIGSVVGGTNGAAPTYNFAVDLQREVAIDNALFGSVGYVTHPLLAATLMKTQQFASTNGVPVWTGNIMDGQVAGFQAMASTQIQSGLTKGTAVGTIGHIVFGDWSSLLIGEWGAMELLVDPYTSGPAVVKLMSIQMVDVFLRYPEKFSAMLDAIAS